MVSSEKQLNTNSSIIPTFHERNNADIEMFMSKSEIIHFPTSTPVLISSDIDIEFSSNDDSIRRFLLYVDSDSSYESMKISDQIKINESFLGMILVSVMRQGIVIDTIVFESSLSLSSISLEIRNLTGWKEGPSTNDKIVVFNTY